MEYAADALTGFATRPQLIADLSHATAPGCPPATFSVFDLGGLRAYAELYGRLEGEALLARIASRLAEALGPSCRYYRPRAEELAALLDGPLARTEPLLIAAVNSLSDRFYEFELSLSFGAASLPDEAGDPVEALVLSDRRLAISARTRPPRERRTVSRGPRPEPPNGSTIGH